MILNSLKSNLGNATVTLGYDEIVKIHNALYECKDEKTKNLLSQFGILHSLTKEGALEELKTIWEIEAELKGEQNDITK